MVAAIMERPIANGKRREHHTIRLTAYRQRLQD